MPHQVPQVPSGTYPVSSAVRTGLSVPTLRYPRGVIRTAYDLYSSALQEMNGRAVLPTALLDHVLLYLFLFPSFFLNFLVSRQTGEWMVQKKDPQTMIRCLARGRVKKGIRKGIKEQEKEGRASSSAPVGLPGLSGLLGDWG